MRWANFSGSAVGRRGSLGGSLGQRIHCLVSMVKRVDGVQGSEASFPF